MRQSAPPLESPDVKAVEPQVTVPRLVELSSAEARTTAEALGLMVEMTDGTIGGPALEGVVVSQTPSERETIAAGGTIHLTIASLTATVPTLTGLTLTTALKELSNQRLTLGKTESRYVPDGKVDTVFAPVPPPGARLAFGAAVSVTVARAAPLSDFKVGIYHVENDAKSKATAERIRGVVRRAGSEADLLPRPPEFFVGRLAATRNEIRYGEAQELGAARELQSLLEKADDLSPFAPRVVRTRSQQFISVFILPETKGPGPVQKSPGATGN